MSADAVIGILIAMVVTLVGVVYGLLHAEIKRVARNVHGLRNKVQAIVMTLATRGIKVPGKDDE
jgi:hypothetical protein